MTTMFKTSLLASSFALVFGACDQSVRRPAERAEPTPTAGAVRVPGDVVPLELVPVAIPAPTVEDVIAGSSPASPRQPFSIERAPTRAVERDFQRILTAAEVAAG